MSEDRLLKDLLGAGEHASPVSAEEVSSYLSGSMDPAAREEFEAFMLACPEVQLSVNIAAHELRLEREEAVQEGAVAVAASEGQREKTRRRFNWLPFVVAIPACGLIATLMILNSSVNHANSLKVAITEKDAFYRGQLAQLEAEKAEAKRHLEEILQAEAGRNMSLDPKDSGADPVSKPDKKSSKSNQRRAIPRDEASSKLSSNVDSALIFPDVSFVRMPGAKMVEIEVKFGSSFKSAGSSKISEDTPIDKITLNRRFPVGSKIIYRVVTTLADESKVTSFPEELLVK